MAGVNLSNSQDAHYLSLLALAEHFRTQQPINIRACVQCLQAVLTIRPPPKVEGRTHLQLGILLVQYTTNIQLAKTHLEQAWNLSMNLAGFDDVKYESASRLAKLYEATNDLPNAQSLLQKVVELSPSNTIWHCRLIFQCAHVCMVGQDYTAAMGLLQLGIKHTHSQGLYFNQLLYTLSKLLVNLLDGHSDTELQAMFTQVTQSIEQYNGTIVQKEHLRVFLMVLHVCHNLNKGQVKSVKPSLKQLQQSIQNISQFTEQDLIPHNSAEMFVWLPRDELCILVYLVSVMHSMHAGYMDKAQKYTEKALVQISKLEGSDSDNNPFLGSLKVMLLEPSVLCHLVMGSKAYAIQAISRLCVSLQNNPILMQGHRSQLHTLLALYSMSMNNQQSAEIQFNAALRTTQNRDLWIFINLNLAMVYLRCHREQDFTTIMDRINPDALPSQSHSLRAAAFYVQGLRAFFTNQHDDGKRFLRESLKMANAEDLNRLTSCSLLLLGHIFLSLGSSREASNMVTPAMQLASKIPDLHLQLWASAILGVLYGQFGEVTNEQQSRQHHHNFSQILLNDHKISLQLPEHNLIMWTDGPFPLPLPSS